jgi:3D-(3,5/4)-trihydroxycyclohexane-1,2-dione acylhydrolase (decyclizing)
LFQDPEVKFAAINIVGRDAYKLSAEPLIADAKAGILALSEAASSAGLGMFHPWLSCGEQYKVEWENLLAPTLETNGVKTMTQAQALNILNAVARPNSYVVTAAGSLPGDINKLWDTRARKRCHIEFGFSCMTYEIPSAIGLCVAGEEHVYVCIGDGTYLMNPSDLIVAVRERLNLTVCIFDNKGYQIIRDLQEVTTGSSFSTEFRGRDNEGSLNGAYLDIDLGKCAASFGATVQCVETAEEFRHALLKADASVGVNVIVVQIEPHAMSIGTKQAFWDIAPPSVTTTPEAIKLRASYEERRNQLQRHYV